MTGQLYTFTFSTSHFSHNVLGHFSIDAAAAAAAAAVDLLGLSCVKANVNVAGAGLRSVGSRSGDSDDRQLLRIEGDTKRLEIEKSERY